MLGEDGRAAEEIRDLIAWSQDEVFWKTVVLDADALRRNYDKIVMKKAAAENKTQKPLPGSAMISRDVDWKAENRGKL